MSEVRQKEAPAAETAAVAGPSIASKKATGLTFHRFFTKAGVSPYDEVEWEKRLAQITDSKGGIIFEQRDVEVPKDRRFSHSTSS